MSDSRLEPLTAIGPLDGRYRSTVNEVAQYTSECALFRYRLRVEILWFVHLNKTLELPSFPPLNEETIEQCELIWRNFSAEDAHAIQQIEQTTKHDVKAVELFQRQKFTELGLDQHLEWIHFGCTSEDINNLAYGLMVQDLLSEIVRDDSEALLHDLLELATPTVALPMLARTHGQPATPTTLGKEIAVFASRIHEARNRLLTSRVQGKMNGAVGNFNAHVIAFPILNWIKISEEFVRSLGLTPSTLTTQIESHDWLAHVFNDLQVLNGILLDFARDVWGYISIGYFNQRKTDGQVGSSTMPHKVNPIDFENAEGNLGIANALQSHLAQKLVVSRWQRDLSDSTAMRNIGIAFGHTLLGIKNIRKGIAKLEPNAEKLRVDLDSSWEILAEAVQSAMRAEGIPESYEVVRRYTQGKRMDAARYTELLAQTKLSSETRDRLKELRPETYVGLAEKLALREIERIQNEVSIEGQ